MNKIISSQRGQATLEILVGIVATVVIAFLISQKMKAPIGTLHEKTVNGITKITGSGF